MHIIDFTKGVDVLGQGRGIIRVTESALDMTAEAPLRMPLVELSGYQRVFIENHRGVIQYSDTLIQIKVCYGRLNVKGNALSLAYMAKSQLVITGCVECICVCREKCQ